MAHGKYMIKVVNADGEEILSYSGETHPDKGQTLFTKDNKKLIVLKIEHVLSGGRDGGGEYFWLDHVRLVVAK